MKESKPLIFLILTAALLCAARAPAQIAVLTGAALIDGTGAGPGAAAALYFHVAADDLFAGAGQYMMDGEQLRRFRAAVVDAKHGKQLAALLGKLTRAGFTIGSYQQLQRVPRGFDPEHPHADLLRRKGLFVAFPASSRALLTSRRLVDELVARAKSAVPLVEWLAEVTL